MVGGSITRSTYHRISHGLSVTAITKPPTITGTIAGTVAVTKIGGKAGSAAKTDNGVMITGTGAGTGTITRTGTGTGTGTIAINCHANGQLCSLL